MNFICGLLLRNWLPTIFALEADPNFVPSSRQSGIGRCRSNLEWRELGDWNRTSSTLVRRSPTVGLGGASVVLTLVTNSKLVGCISGRSAGFASEHVAGLKSEIPGRLNLGAERSFLRLTRRIPLGASSNRISARFVRTWQSSLSNFSLDR